MNEKEIVVNIETNVYTLRAMLKAADEALRVWPGGDPAEQEKLIQMKNELYAVLMSVLLENGIV